jgi:glutamate formiminotransferase
VVPFVPISDVTLEECAALARKVGVEVAARYSLPVYFYEAAASTPRRRRLEHVRRGQFEGLAARMATADGTPDSGPPAPHPTAGASIFGARFPLIAYNINLNTDRLDLAKAIASTVRESSGGLPCLKALGLGLPDRGIVQISMNLTDFRRSPIQVVFDRVRREADLLGVTVHESELVGLIPEAALVGTDPGRLQLRDFRPAQILEHRIRMAGRLV